MVARKGEEYKAIYKETHFFEKEEEGEKKTFFTSSVTLIQKMAEIEEGEEVSVQMKSRKTEDGKWQSYYEVQPKGRIAKDMGDDIPVIEEGEYGEPTSEDR